MAVKDRPIMGGTMTMLERARGVLRDFIVSRHGNVAMMFAIALVPLMIAAGVGLDFARASLVRSQMSDALDAASLAVGSMASQQVGANEMTQEQALALAKKYFASNYRGEGKPDVTITNYDQDGSVTVSASTSVSRTLLKIIGEDVIEVGTSSTTVWGQTKLWVSLVLDNSGSMCQPLSQPCVNTTDTTTKIYQLKAATKKMLTKLEEVASAPGDVRVGIVPFNRAIDVGTANVSKAWIDWTDWEAPPANVAAIDGNVGPGSACPFGTDSTAYGFRCKASSSQTSSNVNTVPSSGLICPGMDNGNKNPDRHERFYNGCWDSVPTQTKTVTKTDNTPITISQNCSQKGTQAEVCTNRSGYPANGTKTSSTVTTTTPGYTGDSTATSTNTVTDSTTNGTKTCDNKNPQTCTWRRTILQTKLDVTVTKTAAAPYSHTWQVNAHSTWGGCIMDRDKTSNYDISNTTAVGFPAANLENPLSSTNCMNGDVTPLNYDWVSPSAKVDAMQARGSTNQAIGVVHGWQMLTPGDPYDTLAVPSNTTRYIILFSDGLNTQNRWWGDGSTENTVEDGYIDDRMDLACSAAKADKVIIYTLYVHTNGGGNSQPLKDCASDSSKYFDLTTVDQIDGAFTEITKQITNVRISQ
jgi:Flp pilus assembly protein TadG